MLKPHGNNPVPRRRYSQHSDSRSSLFGQSQKANLTKCRFVLTSNQAPTSGCRPHSHQASTSAASIATLLLCRSSSLKARLQHVDFSPMGGRQRSEQITPAGPCLKRAFAAAPDDPSILATGAHRLHKLKVLWILQSLVEALRLCGVLGRPLPPVVALKEFRECCWNLLLRVPLKRGEPHRKSSMRLRLRRLTAQRTRLMLELGLKDCRFARPSQHPCISIRGWRD